MGLEAIVRHLLVPIVARSFDFRRDQKGMHLKVKIRETRTGIWVLGTGFQKRESGFL